MSYKQIMSAFTDRGWSSRTKSLIHVIQLYLMICIKEIRTNTMKTSIHIT